MSKKKIWMIGGLALFVLTPIIVTLVVTRPRRKEKRALKNAQQLT